MTKKELTFKIALEMAKVAKLVEFHHQELEESQDAMHKKFLEERINNMRGQVGGMKKIAESINIDVEKKLMPLFRGLMTRYSLSELEELDKNPFEE
jgi:hypothetical protein